MLRMLLSPPSQSQAGAWRGHIGQRGRWDGEDKVGVQNQHPSPPTRLAMFLRLLRVARFQQVMDPLPPQGAKGGGYLRCCLAGTRSGRMGRGGGAGFPAPEQRKGEAAPCQLHRSQQGAASVARAFLRASPGPSGERTGCPSALPTPSFTVMGPMARRPQTLRAGPLLNWQLRPPIAPSWLGNDRQSPFPAGWGREETAPGLLCCSWSGRGLLAESKKRRGLQEAEFS